MLGQTEVPLVDFWLRNSFAVGSERGRGAPDSASWHLSSPAFRRWDLGRVSLQLSLPLCKMGMLMTLPDTPPPPPGRYEDLTRGRSLRQSLRQREGGKSESV